MGRRAGASSPAILLLSLLLAIGIPYSDTAAQTPGPTLRVKLNVSPRGESSGVIRSYVSRALRKLDGVILVDDDFDYSLFIRVKETRDQANQVTGYAISSVGTAVWRKAMLESIAPLVGVPDSHQDLFSQAFAGHGSVPHHMLQVGPTERLKSLCSRLVAEFDSTVLERGRTHYRKNPDKREAASTP